MKCECKNDKFNAHQKCRMDVIVNEHGEWEENTPDDASACYDSETPYGPFTCTKCGKVYEELK